jgi:hypothetical protein
MNENPHMTYAYNLSKTEVAVLFVVAFGLFGAISFGVFGGGFAVLSANANNVQSKFYTPTCEFEAKDGRTIFSFENAMGQNGAYTGFPRLRSDRDHFLWASISTSISAGTYTITTQSFDGYTDRQNTHPSGQSHEQWNVILKNGGTVLGTFGPTTDLLDGVDEDTQIDIVATDISVVDTITKLVASHAFPNTDKPHSVVPVCVAFDEKVKEVPTPQCTMSTNKTEIAKGESATISWTSENTVSANIDQSIGSVSTNGSYEVFPENTTTYTSTFIGENGDEVECETSITVNIPPESPSCPITPEDGLSIYDITTERMRSDKSESGAKKGPFPLSLSAGTYEVTLASYDDHSADSDPTQPKEQWYMQLRTLFGDIIATTNDISDLPDDDDYIVEVVNTALVLGQNVKNVMAVHSAYPDKTSPNSVVPICAAFKKKQEEPKTPSCTLSLSKNEIVKGESVELSWTSENTVSAEIDHGIGVVNTNGATTTNPTVDTTYTATFVGENNETITCEGSVVVREEPEIPSCPLSAGQGDILVDFGIGMIRSDKTASAAQKGPFSATIPAGKYSVTLASYDDHVSKPTQTQPREQWYMQMRTLLGNVIATSGTISDLPNNQDYLTEMVDTEISIVENVKNILVKHAAYPDTTNPNSIVPLCALFKPIPTVEVDPPLCTLSASPSELENVGESVELSWTSENTVSAEIDNGIGAVNTNGATTTSPTLDTTYTATFVGENDETITCSASVTLPKEAPMCTLTIGPASVVAGSGEEVTMVWNTKNITAGEIDNGVGAVGTSGSLSFVPNVDTLYTGTFWGAFGTTTCSARVSITTTSCTNCGGGGGGGGDPRVVISKLDVPNESPLAFVYLSQVPYTGFPASPFVTGLYWFALIVISFVIAYFLLSKHMVERFFSFVSGTSCVRGGQNVDSEGYDINVQNDSVYNESNPMGAVHTDTQYRNAYASAPAPVNLPTGGMIDMQSATSHVRNTELADILERHAHAQGILVSPEGLDLIISLGGGGHSGAEEMLARVMEIAKEHYPREDGWILLNKERVHALRIAGNKSEAHIRSAVSVGEVLSRETPSQQGMRDVPSRDTTDRQNMPQKFAQAFARAKGELGEFERSENKQTNRRDTQKSYGARETNLHSMSAKNMNAQEINAQEMGEEKRTVPVVEKSGASPAHVATFVRWIVDGNDNNIFDFLRSLASRGGSANTFLSLVVSCLDDVYRFRAEGGTRPDKQVAESVASLSSNELEQLLEILTRGVDYSYSSAQTGAKVAVTKATEYLRGRKG